MIKWLQTSGGGGNSDSNTCVVHMHDQSFSKHTLIEICPFEENIPKQEFCAVLHPILPHTRFFGEHVCGIEEFENAP